MKILKVFSVVSEIWTSLYAEGIVIKYVCVCAVISDYQRDILPPVTAQPSNHASVVASILEQHTAELSAAQEWDSEWNSQGLVSRLTPQVH